MQKSTSQMAGTTQNMASNTKSMATTTQSMAQTTDQMNQQMEQLKALTNGMELTTNALYEALRQGNSVTIREQALDTMNQSKTQEKKILYAGIYMMAFEFQVWSNTGDDDEARRESLFQDLFIQLDKDLRNYMSSDKPSLDPTSTNNNMMNLYAMAATLHMINPLQQQLVDNDPKIQLYSALTLIEDALQDNADLNNGKVQWTDLKPYQQEALSNLSDLQYILQLRANFIPALVISKFTSLEYANFLSKLGTLTFGFSADLTDIPLGSLYYYVSYMQEANANREFLQSVGSSADYNCRLTLLYKGMKLPELSEVTVARKDATTQMFDQLSEFEKALPKTSLLGCLL
jgi:hypothetical protein